ncbi:acyl-CoA thioesterase [Pseudomonas entomophila]|uniref:acyl-CoA thioesterase n=1 Tax=Pseudomonas entomophila TaxID=312306 RepID=UPI00240772BA|nr:acyl-CoA thioesterase [Pseudomonas entomophila]MDF9616395.1 acyl-CoA thioesterase [Pseudomonas entomophila]
MPTPIVVTRAVLFGDCDPAGVVYTPQYSFFVVEAIYSALDTWAGAPGLRNLMALDILPPVRAMSLELLSPVTWDDVLHIKVSVEKLGSSSFTFLVEGRVEDGQPAFRCSVTHVCICAATKITVDMPATLRGWLS